MSLPPMAKEFISHFGEMGNKWGINRIAAQVFAMLYLSPKPLHAGELCELLNFSRSYVGLALKDLERWRLIHINRPSGDRRDYYTAVGDVWQIARVLADERRHREIDPTRHMLAQIVEMKPANAEERHIHSKIKEMRDLLQLLVAWHDDMQKMETQQIARLLKLGSKVSALYARAMKSDKTKS